MNIQHSSLIDRIKKMYYKVADQYLILVLRRRLEILYYIGQSRNALIHNLESIIRSIYLLLIQDWKINESLLKKISNAVY